MLSPKDIQTFSDIVLTFEKRSTCARVRVASIIIQDGRIISSGWNGVPKGFQHCNSIHKEYDVHSEAGKAQHRLFSERFEKHAEANAIGQCAKHGIATDGATILQTVSPCMQCAKLIEASGIKEVYYLRDYDRASNEAIDFLCRAGITVFKIDNAYMTAKQLVWNSVYSSFQLEGKNVNV
jgi:dCMP deaminase